jgi:hypothetical protein
MGWTTVENGALLTLASQQFDVFVTVDRNLSFQQNLESSSIAVVVLRAKTNRLTDLRPLVPSSWRRSSLSRQIFSNSLAQIELHASTIRRADRR